MIAGTGKGVIFSVAAAGCPSGAGVAFAIIIGSSPGPGVSTVSTTAWGSGVGTGGTITGIGTILKEHYPDIYIWACEPKNAAILSGGNIGTHLQMGIGDGLIPDILDTEIYDTISIVTDDEAIYTTKALAVEEGILCGISSGTNVCVALKMAKLLGKGKTVVTVLPDTGERYFSTPLFE